MIRNIVLIALLLLFTTLSVGAEESPRIDCGDSGENCPSESSNPAQTASSASDVSECQISGQSSVKDVVHLFAPFKNGGDDIYCRYLKEDNPGGTCKVKGGSNIFYYSVSPLQDSAAVLNCKNSRGQVVQRILTKESDNPLKVFETYISKVLILTVGLGVAISVLMIIYAGVSIMINSSAEGDLDHAKDMMMKGISGVILLILSAVILNTINPLFFQF